VKLETQSVRHIREAHACCLNHAQDIYFDIYHSPWRRTVPQTAKIFVNGRSQAVRLPAAYRFDTQEVFIRKDPVTGDVILSRRPDDWSALLSATHQAHVPEDFLSDAERETHGHTRQTERDPFDPEPTAVEH
jgi:antitoxin VapB